MKYVILTGGLGNQMFEYAFYLSCRQKGMDLRLNRDLYEVNAMHNGYLLDRVFGVSAEDVKKSNNWSVLLTRLVCHFGFSWQVYTDKPMDYNPAAFNTKCRYYHGVFINAAYFKDYVQVIRDAFTFKNIDNRNEEIAQIMNTENSVSVHIRRGDYLKNPIYGVCGEDYYRNAIKKMASQTSDAKFYVFSDDPEWCRDFMGEMNVNYQVIDHNRGADSYKDMYLMTKCRHNIIANSTFSWWGAWLNDNPEKVVIAPSKWTTGIKMNDPLEKWCYVEVK